jgi:hypothetical protein
MRRPLSSELNAEDRLLAQRWAIAVASIYLTIAIVIIAAVLVTRDYSTADKVATAAKSDRSALLHSGGGVP